MSTEKTINSTIRTNLLSNEDFVYAHLVKFERPFSKKVDGTYPTDDSRYAYYTDGSHDIVYGGNTYYANRILSVGNYSETTQARASAMSLVLAGEDIKPAISLAGSISTSGVFTPTSTTYEGHPLDFTERGFKEGDEISFTYSNTTLTYRISSFTSNNTVLNLAVIGTSPDIVSSFPGSTLSQTFSINLESDELTAPLQDRGITVEGTSAANPSFVNRSVIIDKVFIDPETGTIWGNEAIRIFKGVIQNVGIDETEKGVKVKWGLTSHWGDWNQVGGRLTTDEIHRNIGPDGQPSDSQPIRNEYGSDLGFLHAESSLSAIANYKTQETRYRMRSKRRGGVAGLFGGKKYYQEEYQVDIQNEVDLNIHLQGRYLPVVYGVQRVNGNPVFADTLNHNSQIIYTADAICEGEIHGLYNIYIDDIPLICTDDADYSVRGPNGQDLDRSQLQCHGRMSYGDTLNGRQGEIAEETDTTGITIRVDGVGNVTLPFRIPPGGGRWGSASTQVVNDMMLQAGLITGSTGVGHRESWSIDQPYPIDQSVFQGRPNQLASSMLYNPAKVTDGIEGVRVTNAGYGYTSTPSVTISAPAGGGTAATATATRTKDDEGELTKIGSVRIDTPGSGYTADDNVVVTFSGGGGNGAQAQADRGGYKRQVDYYTGTEPYWSSNHRLLDTAYTANRFHIGADSTTIPEIEYVVRGSVIDCFNYDNTYVPDAVLGTSNDHTEFAPGDLVTVQYSTNGSSWTTDTSGNFSGQFKIMDKFLFETNRGVTEYRFRLDKAPSLAVTNGSPARTRLRMVNSSNDQWHMITWNHTLCTDETFPDEFKLPTWSVNSTTGDLTATFSGSDATALGNSVDTNVYQFYSDDWTGLPNLEFGLLPGTWSGNALTFKMGLVGLTSTALTNFNDHVKVRLGKSLDLSNVSAVANITDTKEIVSTFDKADLAGTTRTYPGRGCMLQNTTTGEEREIEAFNATTNVVTLVTAFYTPPTNSHKFTITGRGVDKRATINPAIQTLDYLRNKRYGKGLEDADLDINSFITSARLCDSRSDIEVKLESASSIAVNDIYELKTGGDSNSGTIVAQGKVTKIDTTNNIITLTDVINKFTKMYSTYGQYQEGDIIYTTAGRFYRAGTTVTNTSTTEPVHGGTNNGMTFIGTYSDGDSDNADLTLHKASGSGPSTIKMLKTRGNPVEYALYDSDWVKYWRYYGWERNHQAEVTRHQTCFILDTGKSQFENINSLLSHYNGILSYENGKYVLDVETQEAAPTPSLNASQENINPYYIENSDIIGTISLKDDSQKKGKNTIKASVADPQNNWGSRSITFFNSDFLKADRDIPKSANFPFTGITNYWNGRIGVEKELFASRFSKEINFTIGPRGLLLKVGQVIALTYDSFGFSSKLFRINNLNFNANCTVTIKATEYDDSIYEITKQQAQNINQQSGANYSIKAIATPTLAAPTTDKSGSIVLSWTNGEDYNELTDSTEIWVSNDNNRSNSILLAVVDHAETYTHTTGVQNDKYYWIRHRRITEPRTITQLTHSDYHPASKTGGLQGVSQSISAGAATIELVPSTHVIDYSKGGVETTSVTFSTTTFNMTGTIYYEFLVGTTSKINSTTSTFTLADSDEPAVNGVPIQVTVKARQSSVSGTLLAQDVVTIHSVQDGQDTVTGILTNEAHTIPADVSGSVSGSNLNNAGGTFQVYYGNQLQNGNVADNKISFSVDDEDGVDVSINENTGVYTVSSMSASQGTATFSCTLEGSLVGGIDNTDDVTVTKVYTISKALAGSTGTASAIVYAYQRSASTLSSNPGQVTVSLTGTDSGTITTGSLANGWLKAIPTGSDDLYVCAATASGTGTTDTIAQSEWSSPVLLTQTGADGLNTATVNLYQRTSTASAPSQGSNSGKPEGNSTYTFASAALSFGTANGWSLTNPGINDANPYLWITHATAASTETTDTIAQTEWSTPVLLSQKGDTGATGAVGKTVRLFADDYSIVYDAAGSNPTPSTSTDIVLTATTQNFTNPYFKFTGDGISDETSYSDGASSVHDTFIFPVPASHFTTPKTLKVSVQEGSSGGEVASDTISIFAVKPGADGDDAFTVICSNESHAIPANADGSSPSMGGSGTSFEVFRGTTQLTGITSGTPNAAQFKVTVTDDTNITAGSQSAGSNLITFADHSSMTAATASITYAVLIANTNTITKKQTFSRTNKGATGDDGASAKTVFYRKSGNAATRYTAPSTPSGNITATSIANQWGTTFVAPDSSNVVWQSMGNSADGTTWTWGAPFLYLNWDEIETGFTAKKGWNFSASEPFGFLNFSDTNYNNSNVPANPDSTQGSGSPSASKPDGSTYLQTNVTPNVLWIRSGGSWVSTANINSDTVVTNTNQLTNGAGFITGIDSGAVTGALGFTPYNATNPNSYITGIGSSDVTGALGYTPYNATNPNSYITGITSGNVTGALGYTPYNATNPNGYQAAGDLGWGNITVTTGDASTTWGYNGTAYTPSGTTQTLVMAVTHPSYGTSTVTGTWTRSGTAVVSGFALSSAGGASGSNNTWTFGDVNSDSGSADNAFGSDTASYGTKLIYVQHAASNKILEISSAVFNTNFSIKCLTPTMLPENLQIGDEVDSPQGKTKVIDMQYKEREGYWILEDELEITNDHPILIDGEWILAEEYAGKKEYIDEPTEVVYVETENELLTVKGWTVGGKY